MCDAAKIREQEDKFFDALEHRSNDKTFFGSLYRDGVPSPRIYGQEPIKVLFVFREPNQRGKAHAHDMRDEVSDERFRPLMVDGTRDNQHSTIWWNQKVGMFAHAVSAALAGERADHAFERFCESEWNHAVVNRFAYIQIKKLGGGGTAVATQICNHARTYAAELRRQVELYRPNLVLGCGIGSASPAKLLARYVLTTGRKGKIECTGALLWTFPSDGSPRAMAQLCHPANRRSRSVVYKEVWNSVHEALRA